jgi:hypothetical protein
MDGRGGKLAEYRGGTVVLDSTELWAEWENVKPLDSRPVVDVVSTVAKTIACNDPSLSLNKNTSGWLTTPLSVPTRRVNKFDTPAYNNQPGFDNDPSNAHWMDRFHPVQWQRVVVTFRVMP